MREAIQDEQIVYHFIHQDNWHYIDQAKCVVCRGDGADVELHTQRGKFYVCFGCMNSARRGGVASWQQSLRRVAKRYRLLADRMERSANALDIDAECRFRTDIDEWPLKRQNPHY